MTSPVRVLVSILRRPEKRERLRAQLERELSSLDGIDLAFASDDEVLAALPGRDVLMATTVTPEMLRAEPGLKWVQLISAGVEHVMVPEVLAHPVVITNARGMHVTHMAEHVLALALAFGRDLKGCFEAQAARVWAQEAVTDRVWTLSGRTAGILGLGAVGSGCAARLAALGMRVIGMRRRNDVPVPPGVERAYGSEGLPAVLAEADVLVVTLPLTPGTRGLIGARELAAMKRGAVLINVARGAIVDEAALVAALREGRLAGAGLDVFETEPLPKESPLWHTPGVIVTPHSSGNYPGYVQQATEIFARNLRRYLREEPLENVVDKRAGY